MNRSEEELRELSAWRQKKQLSLPPEKVKNVYIEEENTQKSFHFFNYNPELGPVDLSRVSLRYDESKDPAILSVPLSFTEKSKTVYKQHDRTEFGFDVRTYLTQNNSPVYPIRK